MSKHCSQLNGTPPAAPTKTQEKITFAATLGIVSKFTPARSRQRNGIAEPIVKTIKRDYVFCNDWANAGTVMALLPCWFGKL